MKIGAIGIRTKIIVGDAATWYLVKKYVDGKVGGGIYDVPEELKKYVRVLGSWVDVTEYLASIQNKVDKVEGHSLVPDTEINKLAGYPELENLEFSHENLTDKNSEVAFQHVDTTVTKNTLDEADKVPIYDSVTGEVVLTPKSNLQTEIANNPIATYLFNSNPEIVVSSINYDTNIITSPNHGLVNGDTVVATLNVDTNLFARDVVPANIAIVNPLFKIINATTDTFQITKYDVIVDIVEKVTTDMTKWHFEKINTSFSAISITGLPSLKRCRINVLQRTGNMVYFRVSPSAWTYASASGYPNFADVACFFGFALYDVYIDVESKTLRMTGSNMKQNTGASSYTITPLDRAACVYTSTLTEITTITLQFGYVGGIVNGTEIKIFKV